MYAIHVLPFYGEQMLSIVDVYTVRKGQIQERYVFGIVYKCLNYFLFLDNVLR